MQLGALPRPTDWRFLALALLVPVNVLLIYGTMVGFTHGADWGVLEYAARHAGETMLYAERGNEGSGTFVWSPIAAYPLQIVVPMGFVAWRLVLVAGALAMPTWPLRLMVLASWPFWTDIVSGNLLTLIFLSAAWALRGSKLGTVAFLTFAMLIPRPLLLPGVAWILWQRPEWRIPTAILAVAHGVLVLWTGLGPEWVHTLLTTGSGLQGFDLNLSPTRFIGYWWLVIGAPLGVWLFLRGHVGWAGLAISNYVWIYYLYFAFPQVNGLLRAEPVAKPVRHPGTSTPASPTSLPRP